VTEPERSPFGVVVLLENRTADGFPYDECTPSHLRHPNGTCVDSTDRQFLNAAGAEIVRQWTT
jgi:hypothetical protein